jgi:hypothetical protein
MLTDRLLLAHTFLGITLLESGTRVIFPADTRLGAVYSILTVEDIGTIEVNSSSVDVFDHVRLDLAVIVKHSQAVRHVLIDLLIFLLVLIHMSLNFINLSLNIIERPLLRFLHLDHHLLDLLELLEGVGLHLLKGLLLCDEHAQLIWVVFLLVGTREEGMLDYVIVWGLLLVLESAFLTLSITVVEIVTMNKVLALSSLLLLSRKLHVRHILRLLLLAND